MEETNEEKKPQQFPEDSHALKEDQSCEPGSLPAVPKGQTGGKQVDSTESIVSGSSSEPAPQPQPQFQPETMEVHHHSHAHGKKNWKSYFWEFLMLFLAVFCGFLAEYYLEHRIEKERGKQFIESFYEDLKSDTARITLHTRFDDDKMKGLSNLGDCYDAILNNTNNTACMLEVIKNTSTNRPFIRTDRTLKQLANAGGFRLLKKEDADSILSYDQVFNNFQDFQTTVYQETQNTVRNTLNSFENFKANAQMFKPEPGKIIPSMSLKVADVTEPLLFSVDKVTLNKYFNELQLYYRVTYNHRRMLLELRERQTRLIGYFNNKYHFD